MRKALAGCVLFLRSCAGIRGAIVTLACALFFGVSAGHATGVPSDPCSLLPPSQIGKTLGQAFLPPRQLPAPRAYRNTASGTECDYLSQEPTGMGVPLKVVFILYIESSPAAAKDVFVRTRPFVEGLGPTTPVAGVGDDAYRDANLAVHVLRGAAHYSINFIPMNTFTPEKAQQENDLARWVAGHL